MHYAVTKRSILGFLGYQPFQIILILRIIYIFVLLFMYDTKYTVKLYLECMKAISFTQSHALLNHNYDIQ